MKAQHFSRKKNLLNQALSMALLSLMLPAGSAVAQVTATSAPTVTPTTSAPASNGMSLLQAYDRALEQDATIRASRATLESGLERIPQARSQLLPSAGLSFSRNYNDLTTRGPNALGEPSSSSSRYFSYNQALTIRQALVGTQRYQQYKQAFDQVEEAQAIHDREMQNLVIRAGAAYMDVLQVQDFVTQVQQQRRYFNAALDAANKSLAAGTGTRTDVEEAVARIDLVTALELEARQSTETARRTLESLLNQPTSGLTALDTSAVTRLPTIAQSVDMLLQQARQSSPELRALRARLEAAEREISKAESGHKPTLDAVAQWNRSGSDNVNRIGTKYDTRSIGFQLNIPIYQGGAVSSQVRQAVAEKTRTQEQLEATQRDLDLRIHKEYRGVTEGLLRVRALEQAERSSQQLVQSTERSRQAGVRTTLDILNAQQQLATTQRELSTTRFAYLMSRLRLQALVGKDPRENLSELAAVFVR
jgi:outer membrane protein, protease secretion system